MLFFHICILFYFKGALGKLHAHLIHMTKLWGWLGCIIATSLKSPSVAGYLKMEKCLHTSNLWFLSLLQALVYEYCISANSETTPLAIFYHQQGSSFAAAPQKQEQSHNLERSVGIRILSHLSK